MAGPSRDQFAGSLIGQCLGDALGFVVEGHGPEACRAYVEEVLKSGRAGDAQRTPFPVGQYTDDSQLARELIESYVACSGFDPADYARRIADIFAEGRIVGRGRATAAAAYRLARGVAWDRAATPAPNAGNGSAMRAGPVGCMFWNDPEALIETAHDQGRITHADPRCAAGAIAVAGAVALALAGAGNGSLNASHFIRRLADWSQTADASFADELIKLESWLELAPAEAGPVIAKVGLQPGFSDRWDGISPFVTSSVLWSLYSFLRSPDDYWQTVCTAIAVGGDVDTTAAMAGAISGAYLGLEALPRDLARNVNDQDRWGYDELVGLTHRMFEVQGGP